MTVSLAEGIARLLEGRGFDPALPGCAIRVYHEGKALHEEVRGLRQLGQPEAITPTTNFRLASVTKQFTAACILLLVEDQRLRLGTSLDEIIPDFPAYGADITVADLVGHTSGLKDYEDLMPPDFPHTLRDADVLEIMRGQTSGDFPPGSRYRYSNSGYAVLAMIIEKLSGESFPAFLARRIFGPAGIPRGAVITELAGSPVATVADASRILTGSAGTFVVPAGDDAP